jgi:hypothetical protein
MEFNKEKMKSLVLFICEKAPRRLLGAIKLNKILYYSDMYAFAHWGRSITGDRYVKRQFGPTPHQIVPIRDELVSDGALVVRKVPTFAFDKDEYITMRKADLSLFTPEEIELVTEQIDDICMNHTAASISEKTHDEIWQMAEIGEEIPLFTIFASELGEIDEEDISWAWGELDAASA